MPATARPPAAPTEYRDDSRAADIRYIVGATGSGKTWYTRNKVMRPHRGRLIVWDWKRDYPDIRPVFDDVATFARAALQHKRIRFTPSFDPKVCARQFDAICRVVWTVARYTPEPLLFVAEELSEVTKPAHPPGQWRRLLVMGRVYGLTIVGTTQRPAYVDKTLTGNATTIRCGRLAEMGDANVLAPVLGVRAADLIGLPDRAGYLRDARGKTERFGPK